MYDDSDSKQHNPEKLVSVLLPCRERPYVAVRGESTSGLDRIESDRTTASLIATRNVHRYRYPMSYYHEVKERTANCAVLWTTLEVARRSMVIADIKQTRH
jgi:hypothetical protein